MFFMPHDDQNSCSGCYRKPRKLLCFLLTVTRFVFLLTDHISTTSSYNQVVFVENPRFSTWYISVRRASAMDISEHQVLK